MLMIAGRILLFILLLILLSLPALPNESFARLAISCRSRDHLIPAHILDPSASYPESPIQVQGRLYFVEYSRDQVAMIDLRSKHKRKKVFWKKNGCGPAAITPFKTGQSFLVACYNDHSIAQISVQGRHIQSIRPNLPHQMVGPNDFTHDSMGGIYFSASGVFDPTAPVQGKLFYLSPKLELTEVAENIHYSNGVSVLQDEDSLITSEHFKNRILKYRILSPGKLSSPPEIFSDLTQLTPPNRNLSPGYLGPDGLRQAPDATLYVAQYGGARVIHLNREGKYINQIRIQGRFSQTTNVWPTEDTLIISLHQDYPKAQYPGVIIQIDKLKQANSSNIDCKIQE